MLDDNTKINISRIFKKNIKNISINDFIKLFNEDYSNISDILEFLFDKLKIAITNNDKFTLTEKIIYSIEQMLNYIKEEGVLGLNNTIIYNALDVCIPRTSNSLINKKINNLAFLLSDLIATLIDDIDSSKIDSETKEDITNDNTKEDMTNDNLKENSEVNNDEILYLQDEIAKLKQEKLNIVNTANRKNNELERVNKRLENENILLTEQNKKLISENESIKSNYKVDKTLNEDKVVTEIIKIFLERSFVSLDDIKNLLNKIGYNYSDDKIYYFLNKTKEKINIKGPLFDNGTPEYVIETPYVEVGENRKIIPRSNSLDFAIITDTHIGPNTDLDNYRYQSFANYCIVNNIDYVLHLGDLFDIRINKNYESYSSVLEEISKVSDKYPKIDGVYQGILGGNHDRSILSMGIDPINSLVKNRSDIFSLGYDDASIDLGVDHITLHHIKRRFDYQNVTSIKAALTNYLSDTTFENDNPYIRLFGHCHKNMYFPQDSILFLPSFSVDREQNGFYHMKVQFKSNGYIDYIVFIPLIFGDKLYKTGEIIHQRKR